MTKMTMKTRIRMGRVIILITMMLNPWILMRIFWIQTILISMVMTMVVMGTLQFMT